MTQRLIELLSQIVEAVLPDEEWEVGVREPYADENTCRFCGNDNFYDGTVYVRYCLNEDCPAVKARKILRKNHDTETNTQT